MGLYFYWCTNDNVINTKQNYAHFTGQKSHYPPANHAMLSTSKNSPISRSYPPVLMT